MSKVSILGKQIENLLNAVPQIKLEADRQTSLLVIPKIERRHLAINIVIDFLKRRGLVVYGGTAINAAIVKAGGEPIYGEAELPDFDFYSNEPIKHGIELCNLLHEAGLEYVTMAEALHQCTFKIKIERSEPAIADISWVHKDVYKYLFECQSFLGRLGLRYASPAFQVVDLYSACANPLDGGFYKLEKVLDREDRFNRLYFAEADAVKNLAEHPNRRDMILDSWQNDNGNIGVVVGWVERVLAKICDPIFIGRIAYNSYLQNSGIKIRDRRIQCVPPEVLVEGGLAVVDKVIQEVGRKITDNHLNYRLQVKEYYHYFRFLGRRIVLDLVYNDAKASSTNVAILVVYDMKEVLVLKDGDRSETVFVYSDACVPYKKVRHPTHGPIRIGSYHLTLKYLCGMHHWLLQNRTKGRTFVDLAYTYQYMVTQLRLAMLVWRSKHSVDALLNDKSLFQIAQVNQLVCASNLESSLRRTVRWKLFDQVKYKTYGRFVYKPWAKKFRGKDVHTRSTQFNQRLLFVGDHRIPHFPNNSGNEITNPHDPRIQRPTS